MSKTKPKFGDNDFSQAIIKMKRVIDSKTKTMVLFLSDGADCNPNPDELENEMKYIKSNYCKLICRWWNIGFGPDAESEAMKKMTNIM